MDGKARRNRAIAMLGGALSAGLITFVAPRYVFHLPKQEQILVAVLCICLVLASMVIYNRRRGRRVDTSKARIRP
jgi:high-affinity Fe2+/Pb2+ permease